MTIQCTECRLGTAGPELCGTHLYAYQNGGWNSAGLAVQVFYDLSEVVVPPQALPTVDLVRGVVRGRMRAAMRLSKITNPPSRFQLDPPTVLRWWDHVSTQRSYAEAGDIIAALLAWKLTPSQATDYAPLDIPPYMAAAWVNLDVPPAVARDFIEMSDSPDHDPIQAYLGFLRETYDVDAADFRVDPLWYAPWYVRNWSALSATRWSEEGLSAAEAERWWESINVGEGVGSSEEVLALYRAFRDADMDPDQASGWISAAANLTRGRNVEVLAELIRRGFPPDAAGTWASTE